jgi:hypothetical protein
MGGIWVVVGLFLATPILVTVVIAANKMNLLNFFYIPKKMNQQIQGAEKD